MKPTLQKVQEALAFLLNETQISEVEKISESYAGILEPILEAEAKGEILSLDIQPIRPGPGNSKDGHWYDADMLRTNAPKLVGAKMYETDHKSGEKSTRTWVSTITELKGFKDDGTPIMKTAIHDPSFAQRVKNLAAGKLLEKLECSLLASGTAKPGIREGKQYKVVESITDIESVDWVTRAGAGGKALDIAESDPNSKPEGGALMPDTEKVIEVTPTPETSQAAPVEEKAANPAPAQPIRLSELEVTALLEAEKRLPAASRARLAKGQYEKAEDVKTAAQSELAYLAEAVGSGEPFGLGASSPTKKSPAEAQAAFNEAWDKVNKTKLS